MKKVLSFMLSLIMLLSFGAMTVPTSAADATTSFVDGENFFFSFENESDFDNPNMKLDNIGQTNYVSPDMARYIPGANGSKGAVGIRFETKVSNGNAGSGMVLNLMPGKTYQLELDLKLFSADILKRVPKITLIIPLRKEYMYSDYDCTTPSGQTGIAGYKFVEIEGTNFDFGEGNWKNGDWGHLNATFEVPTQSGGLYLKPGQMFTTDSFLRLGQNPHALDSASDFTDEFLAACGTVSATDTRKALYMEYGIDNVSIRPASLTAPVEEEESPYLWDINFEDNSWNTEVEGANVGVTYAKTKELVEDVPKDIADTSKKSLKWSYAGNTGNNGYTDFDVTVTSNETKLWFNRAYEISFWAKGSEAAAAFHKANTNRVTTIIPERSDNARMDKTFPMWQGYNTSDLITTEWKKYTYLYYEEMPAALSAEAENPFALKFHLRFQCVPGKTANDLTAADGTAYAWSDGTNNYALNDFQFYLDDFKVKPLDIVYNGDFEALSGTADYNTIWYNGATNKYTSKMGEDALSTDVFHNGTIVQGPQGNYLSVTENGGAPYQGVNVEKGRSYTISFKAKAADANAVGKNINVVLDRDIKGEVLDNSQYTFTDIPKWVGYKFDAAQSADVVLNTEGYDGYGAPTGVTGSVPFYMYGGVVTNGHHAAGTLKPVSNNETLIYDDYYDRMFSKNTQAGKAPTAWGYQYYNGTEWVGTNDIADATSSLTLTNDWKEYTMEYQWDYEGKHYRLPKLTFLDDASYDLKDIQITETEFVDPSLPPYFRAENVVATGKDVLSTKDCITVTWDFVNVSTTVAEEAADSVIKLYERKADGSLSYIAATVANEPGKAEIKATSDMFGKELVFEVIPVDTDGNYGESGFGDFFGKVALAFNSALTEGADHNSVDYSLSIKSAGETGKAVSYIAMYKDGKMVGISDVSLDYANGDNQTSGNFPMVNGADKAKLFVWDNNFTPMAKEKVVDLYEVNETPFAGDNEINVVYLGDSIYEGAGASSQNERWVNQVGAWFTQNYAKNGVTVNNHYKGVGGTTTEYSLMRLQRDVIANNPDLVFISATINDGNRDVTFNLESMVRTLQSLENPPYIVLTRTANRNYSTSHGYVEKVAEFYNVPLIDDLEAFRRATTPNTDVPMADMFIQDGVHPSDKGYDVITDEIISCMSTNRYYHKGTPRENKLYEGSGVIKNVETFEVTDASRVTLEGNWTTSGNIAYIKETGASIKFSFTGNAFGFLYGLNHYGANAEVYVDGKLVKTGDLHYNNIIDRYQYVFKETSSVFELDYGTHEVEIKMVPGVNAGTEGKIDSAIRTFFTATIE